MGGDAERPSPLRKLGRLFAALNNLHARGGSGTSRYQLHQPHAIISSLSGARRERERAFLALEGHAQSERQSGMLHRMCLGPANLSTVKIPLSLWKGCLEGPQWPCRRWSLLLEKAMLPERCWTSRTSCAGWKKDLVSPGTGGF